MKQKTIIMENNVIFVAKVKRGLNKCFIHLKKGDEFELTKSDVESWKNRGYLVWASKPNDYEIINKTYIDVYKVTKIYEEV